MYLLAVESMFLEDWTCSCQRRTSPPMQADVPVVVDFWAHWCGPCKLIDPVMKQLDADSNGQLKVVKVEVDGNPQLVEKYGVCTLQDWIC